MAVIGNYLGRVEPRLPLRKHFSVLIGIVGDVEHTPDKKALKIPRGPRDLQRRHAELHVAAIGVGLGLKGEQVPGDMMGAPLPAGVPITAFFTNPTRCAHTPMTRIAVTSWQNPGNVVTDTADADIPTGCDRPIFDPSITFRPDAAVAGAPSAYSVAIDFRQNDDPVGISPSALRTAVVRLPLGTVVSPSSTDGPHACSPAQIGLRSAAAVACPEQSKIGTSRSRRCCSTRR